MLKAQLRLETRQIQKLPPCRASAFGRVWPCCKDVGAVPVGALIHTQEGAAGVAFLVFCVVGVVVFFKILFLVLTTRSRVSSRPTTFGDARFASLTTAKDAGIIYGLKQGEKNVCFLGYILKPKSLSGSGQTEYERLEYSAPAHLLTVAPSRSGKGACVIIPNLLRLTGGSVIVIDPKGENAAITAPWRETASDVYLLNPFDEHGMGTAKFNPLAHLSINHPNVVGETASLAEALVPAAANESGNSKHFTDSARSLVQALLLHLLVQKGSAATLPHMRAILARPESLAAAIVDMSESPHHFIAELASQFTVINNEINSVISSARIATKFLSVPAFVNLLSGSDFAMLDLKERPISLYVILPSRYLQTYAQFLRLVIVSALDQLQSRAGGVKTLFLLDEFAALGHLSQIEIAFGQAAGFNIQLWPFLQDLNQLKDLYASRWESFIANAGAVQWFAPQDQFTADYLSKRLGNKTVETKQRSTGSSQTSGQNSNSSSSSSSESYGEAGVPLMAASELMGLPAFQQLVTVAGLSYPIKGFRHPYHLGSEARAALLPPAAADIANLQPAPSPFHS